MTMEDIFLARICLQIIGMSMILCFLFIYYQTRKSERWLTIKGKVLFSSLSQSNTGYENKSKVYNSIIEYQYEIDGKIYSSKRAYHGDWLAISSSSYMKKIVKQYSIGKECIVHYNPRNPQKSVLIVKLTPPVFYLLLFGLVCIGTDIFISTLV